MRIGIVGTGTMASGFARALSSKHEVEAMGGLGFYPDGAIRVLTR